jgi:hypothetical protein
MKMCFKKLTASFLAVLMVISVLSVMTVSAAQKNDKGEYMFKFTNTKNWSDIYVYAWNNDNTSLCGDWPGWKMESPYTVTDYGQEIFWLVVPCDATAFLVHNGQGEMTTDITDFSPEGYWVDDTNQAQPWYDYSDDSSGASTENDDDVSGNLLFTDTLNWGNIHCYAYNDDGGENASWPGVKMDGPRNDGWGYQQYGIYLSDVYTHVIFNDGRGTDAGGNQTPSLDYSYGIKGYYYDYETGWASWGDVDSEWSDGSGEVSRSNTVYLNPGNNTGSWYVWSYNGEENGEFISGVETDRGIRFNNVARYCCFVKTSGKASWAERIGQTDSMSVENGGVYVLDGYGTEADDGFGNPFIQFSGSWDSESVTDYNIYFNNSAWNDANVVYCHIYEVGVDSFYPWQSKKESCKKVADKLYSYDLSGLNLSRNKNYCVIFSDNTGIQTYEATISTECFGDTLNVSGKKIENSVDSEKFASEAVWSLNSQKYGPHFAIGSTGNLLGTFLCPNEKEEDIIADWLYNYYNSVYMDVDDSLKRACRYLDVKTVEQYQYICDYLESKVASQSSYDEMCGLLRTAMNISETQETTTALENNKPINTYISKIHRSVPIGKDESGQVQYVDSVLSQARTVFDFMPSNTEELKQMHFSDTIINNESEITDTNANGRFEVVALLLAALKAYNPDNPEVAYNMMEELCDSPTSKNLSIDTFNSKSRDYLSEQLNNSYKYKYLANSYFVGASPDNGYSPDVPYTVVLEDYIYAAQHSESFDTDVYKISFDSDSDSERIVQVYQDKNDGKWYIFSDSWKTFLGNIIPPDEEYINQWNKEDESQTSTATEPAETTAVPETTEASETTAAAETTEVFETTAAADTTEAFETTVVPEETEASETTEALEETTVEIETIIPQTVPLWSQSTEASETVTAAPVTGSPATTAAAAITQAPTAKPTVTPAKTAVQKGQTITAKSFTKSYGQKPFNLNAKSSGGTKLSYKSSSKKVATVDANGKVSIKGCGKATITITAASSTLYKSASKKITVTVKPGKIKFTTRERATKKGIRIVKVNFKPQKNCDGYDVQISFKNSFKDIKSAKLKKTKKTVVFTKVTVGTKYYLRLRAYKKTAGKKTYGKWSKTSFVA